MNWSPQQEAIYSAAGEDRSLMVVAVAGSGKTTTGVETAARLSPPRRTAMSFLAFNKKIATELEEKLPGYCQAKTLNSFGFATLLGKHRAKVNGDKISDLLEGEPQAFAIQRLVSAAKNFLFIEPSFQDWQDLSDYLALEIDDEESAFLVASEVLEKSRNDLKTIDFDDQLYIPVIEQIRGPKQRAVLVDEVQDLSLMQIEFLKLITDEDSQIIGFGDPNQAIYKFRGADNEACGRFSDTFSLEPLPLSVSYRCPKAVVAEAQNFVPRIEASSSAPMGHVEEIPYVDFCELPPDALFMARTNGPVIQAALKRLRARQQSNVLGRFPRQLQGFVRSFRKQRADELIKAANDHLNRIANKYGSDSRRYSIAADKVNCVEILSEGCSSTKDILNRLEEIIRSNKGPKLSTIHQAKGLESPNVYFFHPEKINEDNLLYVGITRSLKNLYYIGGIPQ